MRTRTLPPSRTARLAGAIAGTPGLHTRVSRSAKHPWRRPGRADRAQIARARSAAKVHAATPAAAAAPRPSTPQLNDLDEPSGESSPGRCTCTL